MKYQRTQKIKISYNLKIKLKKQAWCQSNSNGQGITKNPEYSIRETGNKGLCRNKA